MPITIGDIKLPSKIPNLNQILFKGLKIGEFNKPKIKKIIAGIIAQILILPYLNNGNNEIVKKNIKKTIPKPLLELAFNFINDSWLIYKEIITPYLIY
tara:strand:- start:39 stop:332 length:294 start_codon:yes stop_codon:yes gene_type:complete